MMKNSSRQTLMKEQRSKSANSILIKFKRDLTPTAPTNPIKKSLPRLENDKIKKSYNTINSSKKYSILSVPKTPSQFPAISSSLTPMKQTEQVERLNFSSISTSVTTNCQSANQEFKFSKKSRIRLANRYRKNPNQENLKLALQEIEKNPSKKSVLYENKSCEPQMATQKSDIENLLESQGSQFRRKREKKAKHPEGSITEYKSTEPIESNIEIESQISDPSPVREKPIELKASQTPRRQKRSLSKDQSKVLKFLIKNKADPDLIEKIQSHQDCSEFSNKTRTQKENISKALVDYRQESLKILKDTSFFANKIMKAIRCPARIKRL